MTLDAETRKQSGVEIIMRQGTPYQDEVRADGTVLDLDKLVTLDNNYVIAVAQLQTAQSHARSLEGGIRARGGAL